MTITRARFYLLLGAWLMGASDGGTHRLLTDPSVLLSPDYQQNWRGAA